MLDVDDDPDYLGGLNAAVRSIRGDEPTSFAGDSSHAIDLKPISTAEDCLSIFRAKSITPNGWKD